MKKKIILSCAVVSVIAIIVFSIIVKNNTYNQKCEEFEDINTKISYLKIDNILYPQICADSADYGLFSENTVNRMKDVYLCEDNRIITDADNIFMFKTGTFQNQKYGYKNINENERLYFYFDNFDNKILNFYADEGFELPQFDAENIEQVRLEYIDNSAGKNRIIKDSTDINELIINPTDYFNKNQVTDIYVKFKGCDFEEWYDLDKIINSTAAKISSS